MSEDLAQELESYFPILSSIASQIINGELEIEGFLCSDAPSDVARNLVATRSNFVTEKEHDEVQPYLQSYDLNAWPVPHRPAVLLVWDDLVSMCRRLSSERECEPYSRLQPLFQSSPLITKLIDWSQPQELLNINDLPWVDKDSVYLVANDSQWARPSGLLRDELIEYLRVLGKDFDVSIRLDAYSLSPANQWKVQEAVARQADPRWWPKLAIHPGERKYSEYVVPEGGSFWENAEFRQGLRRLEANFLRRNAGHLMSSVEELAFDGSDLLTGRLLHCDTAEPIGTDWHKAVLGHIDGAINVYRGADSTTRFAERLDKGKIVKATVRTHLFRVNGAPIRIITELAQLFFRSEILVRDWLSDQFGE